MASNPLLEPYIKLTEFLGLALGPDYEIVLYDLTDRDPSILAVANGHDSRQSAGAPQTASTPQTTNVLRDASIAQAAGASWDASVAQIPGASRNASAPSIPAALTLSALRDKNGEISDYRLHYPVMTASGKTLRSNTWYIKDGQHLIGMLCVNFDDSRYRALGAQLMELGHPESFDTQKFSGMAGRNGLGSFSDMTNQNGLHFFPAAENEYPGSADEVTAAAVRRELDILGVTPDRLTAAERHQIIAALDQSGIFRIKGSVKKVASELDCSQASVYRYLAHVRNGQAGPNKDR